MAVSACSGCLSDALNWARWNFQHVNSFIDCDDSFAFRVFLNFKFFLSVLLIYGSPVHSACLLEVFPLCNLDEPLRNLCYFHCLLSKSCSCNIFKVSLAFSPSLKQNLMHTFCCFMFSILSVDVCQNCRWHNMHLYLTAVLQAGSDSADFTVYL